MRPDFKVIKPLIKHPSTSVVQPGMHGGAGYKAHVRGGQSLRGEKTTPPYNKTNNSLPGRKTNTSNFYFPVVLIIQEPREKLGNTNVARREEGLLV